jgi:nitroreductase
MQTFEAICGRASVREYLARPVDKEILEKLVDAGRRAPTARAVEPWEFIVITERGTLTQLGEIAPNGSFIKGAAACIAVLCKDTKYYLEDGCAATENILLAAADSGLGACWVAGDKKPYAPQIINMLAAPPDCRLVSLVSLGWPKEKPAQVKNRQLKEIIHYEKF